MSMTPVAICHYVADTGSTVGKFTPGVPDTGGKVVTGIVDIRGKFAAGVIDSRGKFATRVFNTGGVVHLTCKYLCKFLKKFKITLLLFSRALGKMIPVFRRTANVASSLIAWQPSKDRQPLFDKFLGFLADKHLAVISRL